MNFFKYSFLLIIFRAQILTTKIVGRDEIEGKKFTYYISIYAT